MNPYAKEAHCYQQSQIISADPLQLVVLLYEGALAHIGGAVRAIEMRSIETRSNQINRACAMIAQLQSSLDMQRGGEIAVSLDRLYTYITRRLCEANSANDVQPLEESRRLLSTLWSAWREIAEKGTATPPAQTASRPRGLTVNG